MIRGLLLLSAAAAVLAQTNGTSSIDRAASAAANGGTGSTAGDLALFESLWAEFSPMADTNGDGKISTTEIQVMFRRLDIDVAEVNRLCSCVYTSLVATYDADNDGALSSTEMMNLANNERQLGPVIIAAVGNAPQPGGGGGGGGMPDMQEVMNPPAALVEAAAQVSKSFTVSGGQIYPGDRRAIREAFSTLWSVPMNQLISSYQPVGTAASRIRRLQTTEWNVSMTAFVADQAAADAAASAADTALADPAAASTFTGVTVTAVQPSAAVPAVGMKPMPMGSFALVILIPLLLITSCVCGCVTSNSKMKSKGESDAGCTKTGCCSNNALGGWSTMLFVVSVILLLAVLMLYQQTGAFVTAVESIIDTLLQATAASGPVGNIAANLPTAIIDQARAQLGLARIAVIIPGGGASILLIIVSVCGVTKKKGGFCCAKLLIMLSYIFLLLSFIAYIVFLVVSVVVFVPETQRLLRQYLVICDTTVPSLTQTLADAERSLEMATAAGMSAAVAAAQPQVDEARQGLTLINGLCAGIRDLITAIEGFLVPSLLAWSMVIVAWFTSFGTCCGMGCCGSPHGSTKIAAAA